jgi:hypothetical protein
MNANRRNNRVATATAFAFAALFTVVTAPSAAQAQEPEAYIGTFMPHGLEGRDYVDRHIARIQHAMLNCYEQTLESSPRTAGMMLTRVFLDRSGQVTEVAVMNNQTGDTALASCVEAEVADVRFAATYSDNASITIPVTFRLQPRGVAVAQR